MDWKRTQASIVNWFGWIFLINVFLWLLEKPLLGEKIYKVPLPKGRLDLFIFSLITLLLFASIAGWLANAVFWAFNKSSIPNIIFYKLID